MIGAPSKVGPRQQAISGGTSPAADALSAPAAVAAPPTGFDLGVPGGAVNIAGMPNAVGTAPAPTLGAPNPGAVVMEPATPPAPGAWFDTPGSTIYNLGQPGPFDATTGAAGGLDSANPYYIVGADGAPSNVSLPDWAVGTGLTPDTFYSIYNSFTDIPTRDQWVVAMQSAKAVRDQQAGEMQPILDDLERRSSPDFDFLTGTQQRSAQQLVAQQYARGASAAQADAAGRGTGFGGAAAGRNASLRSFADATGMQLQAQHDATNQAARDTALSTTASILSDRQYEPLDMVRFMELDRDRTALIQETIDLDEAKLAAEEAASEFTFRDLAPLVSGLTFPNTNRRGRNNMILAAVESEILASGFEGDPKLHEVYESIEATLFPGRFNQQTGERLEPLSQWDMLMHTGKSADELPGIPPS